MNIPTIDSSQLQDLERQTYRAWIDDGLADIFLGLSTLILGTIFFADIHIPGTEFDIAGLFFPALYPLWDAAKRWIVEPRVGYFRMREALRVRMGRRLSFLVLLFFSLAMVLVAIAHFAGLEGDSSRTTLRTLAAFAFAIPVALASHWLDLRRWTFYAGLIAVAALFENLAEAPFGTAWLAAGGLVTVMGLTVLARFLQSHPPLLDERGDE